MSLFRRALTAITLQSRSVLSINNNINRLSNTVTVPIRSFRSSPALQIVPSSAAADNKSKQTVPITFIDSEGNRSTVAAPIGSTVLQVARQFQIPILGECEGGGLGPAYYSEGPMCTTCHVFIDNTHLPVLPARGDDELDILYWIDNSNRNSRLACELIVKPEMKGMTVVIPYIKPLREINT